MRRITDRKDEVRVKEKNSKDSDLEYGIVCRRNMDVEESEHSKAGIVWNVDLENVNENQLDWTSIQSRRGHGGWKQKLDEHHPTKTKKLLSHVLRSESHLRTMLEGRMEGIRTRGRQSDTMIDWMKSNDVKYDHIKKRAHGRKDWRHWRPGPAWKGRAHKRDSHFTYLLFASLGLFVLFVCLSVCVFLLSCLLTVVFTVLI